MSDLVLGWLLGLASSLVTSLLLYWLEGKREIRAEAQKQRREDVRTARNWAQDGRKISLRGFDLTGANLSGKDLAEADLEDASFNGARMWATNLRNANLIGASFQKAKLVGAIFTGADLYAADFTGAVIKKCDFSEANLKGVNMQNAKEIRGCKCDLAEVDENTETAQIIKRQKLSWITRMAIRENSDAQAFQEDK